MAEISASWRRGESSRESKLLLPISVRGGALVEQREETPR
jgi:hypothetical protein